MASTFKNAGKVVGVLEDSTADLYTAGAQETAVIHALYISNNNTVDEAKVNIKVTIDGGTTFRSIGKSLQVPASNTLTLDKPINLENYDKLRVFADAYPDAASVDVEVVASILAIT